MCESLTLKWPMFSKFYTGVGSRETPEDVQKLMTELAWKLATEGWTLRSGGADGADSAFEAGAMGAATLNDEIPFPEIYLPWKGFNGNTSILYPPHKDCYAIASKVHPAWLKMTPAGKTLHARNVHQVYGRDLRRTDCSSFGVCWTPKGEDIGGTRTAITLLKMEGRPVFNLAKEVDRDVVITLLNGNDDVGTRLSYVFTPEEPNATTNA